MKLPWFNDGISAPRADVYLTRRMATLGENIARNPLQFLGFTFLLILLFSSGFQQLRYESDPGYLFVPSGARAFDEQNVIKKYFPNKMKRFVRGAEDSVQTMAEIAVLPLAGENILRQEIWKECFNLVKAIETIQVVVDEDQVMWKSVCVKFEGECLKNDFLSLYDRIGIINFTYPLMTDPDNQNKVYPLLAHIGSAVVDDNGYLKSAKALKLSFIMDNSTKKKKKAGEILSQVIRMYASSIQFKHIKVYSVTDMTIEEELSHVIDSAIEKMPLTIVFVVAFAVYNCLSTDWVRSKPIIGVVSVIISGLSFTSASGLALYLGVPWQAINIITLPLTLGIGLDDCFVLLSAWWRSEVTNGRDVVSRMSATYSEAAVSITVTSLTNVVSFWVGAAIPGFPAVKIFCFYAGLCMGILYVWSLFILGACLTLAGHLEHANRHCILLIKVDSKSEAEREKSWWYSVILQGGVGKKDANNPRDHKDGKFMGFFRDYLAPMINKPLNKAIILVCFLAYLGAAIYGVTKLEEGLERTKLVGHASYAKPFFDTEDTYFRDNPYRFQIIIEEPLDYWNETVRNQVLNLIHQLEDSDYISSSISFRQSWLHEFMQRVEQNFLFFDISSQKKFVDNVIQFLEVLKDTPLFDDVIISEDNRTIPTSRFFLQSSRIEDATKEVMLLQTLRMIVDDAPFKATIFHPYFSFFDQFAQVTRTTLECVIACCICMTIITALFIPDKRSIIWVTFTILSVEVGIIGFMSLLGIRLDVISMIVIIMGIGFSVDFSAHISYHYLTVGADVPPNGKVCHCLYALGPPIVRGGMSTVIAVFGLYFHPSYVTETFATMIFLIIFLGIMHSLLLLPVLLSLFGPGSAVLSVSHIGLASPSQLSETFTYKASLTPKKLAKKKTDSLRRLVLSSGVRNNDVSSAPEPLDNTDSSLSSWYPNQQGPDFKNYVMQRVTSTQLNNVGELKKTDGTYTVKEKPDPLPYYKFAHVKRGSRHTRFVEPTNNNDDEERLDESFDGENSWQDLQDESKK